MFTGHTCVNTLTLNTTLSRKANGCQTSEWGPWPPASPRTAPEVTSRGLQNNHQLTGLTHIGNIIASFDWVTLHLPSVCPLTLDQFLPGLLGCKPSVYKAVTFTDKEIARLRSSRFKTYQGSSCSNVCLTLSKKMTLVKVQPIPVDKHGYDLVRQNTAVFLQ